MGIIYDGFREEVERLDDNDGKVIVPSVIIESPDFSSLRLLVVDMYLV